MYKTLKKLYYPVYCHFHVLVIKLIYTSFNEMKQQLRQPVISTIIDPCTSIFQIWQTFA